MARSWLILQAMAEGVFKLARLRFQPHAPCGMIQTLTGEEAGVVAHAQTPPEKTGVAVPTKPTVLDRDAGRIKPPSSPEVAALSACGPNRSTQTLFPYSGHRSDEWKLLPHLVSAKPPSCLAKITESFDIGGSIQLNRLIQAGSDAGVLPGECARVQTSRTGSACAGSARGSPDK